MTHQQQIRLKWEGNSSPHYDGVTQDVAREHMFPKDLHIGQTVRVKWGRSLKVWTGVVMDLLTKDSSSKHVPSSPRREGACNKHAI